MSRRLLPTLADYVVIAINPALIMGLVGSLVYFLLEVFYVGQYPEKLHFSLSAFVFASVLVSRIAMESGFQHAAPFGMALAVVVGLALNAFVDYRGTPVGHFGWLINWGLMALIWWAVHKLTWDCTAIDESEEAAGRGLLETAGIDPASGVSADDSTQPVADQAAVPPPTELPRTRWQNLIDPPQRPHTPGVWIVYFSLASLPIFGFGQAFIPAAKVANRRYAFELLCVYVACGLALLLTTSFLSVRRYLRQRRLEMPLTMVGSWLTTGGVMIVVLLFLAALLPRPSPEFAISELPWQAKSVEHQASKVSVGSEGVRDSNAAPDSGVDHSPEPANGEDQQSGEVDTRNGTGQSGAPAQTGGKPASSGGQQPSSSSGSQSESKSSSGGSQGKSSDQSSSQNQPQQNGQSQSQPPPPGQEQAQGQPQQPQQQGQTQGQAQEMLVAAPKPLPGEIKMPSAPQIPSLGELVTSMLGPLKWVFYAVVICAVIYGSWQYREELLAIVAGWIEAFRDFWAVLFSGRRFDEDAPELEALHANPLAAFSEFTNPFAQGTADRYGTAEVVKYTFAALEVWGRKHGTPREPDQTPSEFAQLLGAQMPDVAADAQDLASLYGRAVYSEGALPSQYVANLRHLWHYMQTHRPQPAEAAGPTLD